MAKRSNKIFHKLAKDLASITGGAPNIIRCPICLACFEENALCANDTSSDLPELSIEHIIPYRLGGRLETLTCKKCNNDQGSGFDAHLINMIEALDFFEGIGRPMKASMNIADFKSSALIDWHPINTRMIHLMDKATDPRSVEGIKQAFESGVEQIDFSMRLNYNRDRAHMALLRSAYLMIFNCYGYRYAMSTSVVPIREGLLDERWGNLPKLVSSAEIPQIASNQLPNFVTPGFEVKGKKPPIHLVLLTIRRNKPRSFFVIMPTMEEESAHLYEMIDTVIGSLNGAQFHFMPPGKIFVQHS